MYGLKRLASAAGAAAEIYRKRLLRSVPISRRSLTSAGGFGINRKAHKRKRLPAELSASAVVAELSCDSAARGGVCHVYLIGTKHRSPESKEEVRAVIRRLKPEAVFLELCPSRANCLDKTSKEKGHRSEFSVANEEAMKCGAKVILGDRPIGITLRRFSVMAFLWEFCVIIFTESKHHIRGLVKKLKGKVDASTMDLVSGEMSRMFPSFCKTFGDEREMYMSAKLLEVAREHNSVVAIVGKGHVKGIQEHWKQPIDVKQLLRISIGKRMFTTPKGIGATVAITSVIYLLKDVIVDIII